MYHSLIDVLYVREANVYGRMVEPSTQLNYNVINGQRKMIN